jgi:hypothetical protein
MANKFVGFLETVGKDFLKGLGYAVKYAVPVEKLVGLLFPAAAPAMLEIGAATSLIQTAVIAVEQKYAAAGIQSGSGAQKVADVLLVVEQAVTSLLAKAGVAADSAYIQSLVNAVVAILNVQAAPVTGAA